jgi:hypothetical protein
MPRFMPIMLKPLMPLCVDEIRRFAVEPIPNTYAKIQKHLQRTLDVYWLIHNFIRVHFTTGQVPAVALGILQTGLSLEQLLSMRYAC